jgi:hypothetical protein
MAHLRNGRSSSGGSFGQALPAYRFDEREIFDVVRFSTFSTLSAKGYHSRNSDLG